MSEFILDAIRAMLVCAIWSSVDENGEPLDYTFLSDDIDPATVKSLNGDLIEFIETQRAPIEILDLDAVQVGHDFWLTRNGHGAGFWDRGNGILGDQLADAARAYGSVDLYVGDDGLIYA